MRRTRSACAPRPRVGNRECAGRGARYNRMARRRQGATISGVDAGSHHRDPAARIPDVPERPASDPVRGHREVSSAPFSRHPIWGLLRKASRETTDRQGLDHLDPERLAERRPSSTVRPGEHGQHTSGFAPLATASMEGPECSADFRERRLDPRLGGRRHQRAARPPRPLEPPTDPWPGPGPGSGPTPAERESSSPAPS